MTRSNVIYLKPRKRTIKLRGKMRTVLIYDPDLRTIGKLIQESKLSYAEIAEKSGVTVQTLYNWVNRKVKRPQHYTMSCVAEALGYRWVLQMIDSGRVSRRA